MPGPVCLNENIQGELVVDLEALKILSAITQPVVVVAIVGLYRTGKSYLMNKLAGKKKGFSLGSMVQSHTKRIWMWCVPHQKKTNHIQVLLDTEGLGDVEKEILVLTYVDVISSGDLPCMENAVLTLAQIENSAAIRKAMAHYDQQMSQKVQLPMETLQELLDLHRASEKEAIEVSMRKSFKDMDQKFQKELGKKRELKNKYYQVTRKGIQAEETLKKHFESKEDVADALLQTDQSLSEKEKETEVECVKAESAEAAKKMLEEMQKKNEQMMEQKEKSYQEHAEQLTEKMERDWSQLMAEQERTLVLKLQEQEWLLKEGFQKGSRKLQQQMQAIQMRSREPCIGCNRL